MKTQGSLSSSTRIPNYLPNPRFFVPDLSPEARSELRNLKPKYLFVAESPHIQEVEPLIKEERRPLCGAAGKQWWGLLGELLESSKNTDLTLPHLVSFCKLHRIAVINAIQYPLDPKVAKVFPEADPVKNLGFNKVSGAYSFKNLKETGAVQTALRSLNKRLNHSAVAHLPIYCLGNDSEWLVKKALGPEQIELRYGGRIPHPAAWWRKGGLFGRMAREKLGETFLGN